jgi:hypothetical protein
MQVDTLITAVGTEVGMQLSSLLTLVVGLIVKVCVDLGKKASEKFAAAPGMVKTLAVIFFGQVVIWVNAATGIVLTGDLTSLDTTLSGIVLAAVSMGLHAVSKLFKK